MAAEFCVRCTPSIIVDHTTLSTPPHALPTCVGSSRANHDNFHRVVRRRQAYNGLPWQERHSLGWMFTRSFGTILFTGGILQVVILDGKLRISREESCALEGKLWLCCFQSSSQWPRRPDRMQRGLASQAKKRRVRRWYSS